MLYWEWGQAGTLSIKKNQHQSVPRFKSWNQMSRYFLWIQLTCWRNNKNNISRYPFVFLNFEYCFTVLATTVLVWCAHKLFFLFWRLSSFKNRIGKDSFLIFKRLESSCNDNQGWHWVGVVLDPYVRDLNPGATLSQNPRMWFGQYVDYFLICVSL